MPTTSGLFKTIWEFVPKGDWNKILGRPRGIYVLFNKKRGQSKYRVVYVGRSVSNVTGRLASHARSKKKRGHWSHFTIFAVHDKITARQIAELEQFILFVFRKDPRTMGLNWQKSTSTLRRIREKLPEA